MITEVSKQLSQLNEIKILFVLCIMINIIERKKRRYLTIIKLNKSHTRINISMSYRIQMNAHLTMLYKDQAKCFFLLSKAKRKIIASAIGGGSY